MFGELKTWPAIGQNPSGSRTRETTMNSVRQTLDLAWQYYQTGQWQEAEQLYRQVLEVDPRQVDALHLLAAITGQTGRETLAVDYLREVLRLQPGLAAAHNNLGNALAAQGKYAEATTCFQEALRLKPDYAVAYNNLGNSWNDLGNLVEAVGCFRRALELNPALSGAHYNLGAHFEQIGDFEGAQRCWRETLRLDPRHARALAGLATVLGAQLPAGELAALADLASSSEISAGDRASLLFGLANVANARGDYAAAARYANDANSLSLANRRALRRDYDLAAHDRLVTAMIESFAPAHFERVRGSGMATDRPVFIFGLPRSGTTLTEQILAGHSQVFGAGELQLAGMTFETLPQVTSRRATPMECVAALDQQMVGSLARDYLERLDASGHGALRIVDKMPGNLLYVGFLATLFPNAKFIHCRRDLRDVAVSCWLTELREVDWSNAIEHIAHRFCAHQRLMDHWRQVLPVKILEVDYERTVTDLEGTARQLIAWCGLDWEPQCLSFHTRRAPVRTASAVQVRQPIYRHAVARWKNYEDLLAPLLEAVTNNVGSRE
jgi:tetratricopeptide (TPR) repeat protein